MGKKRIRGRAIGRAQSRKRAQPADGIQVQRATWEADAALKVWRASRKRLGTTHPDTQRLLLAYNLWLGELHAADLDGSPSGDEGQHTRSIGGNRQTHGDGKPPAKSRDFVVEARSAAHDDESHAAKELAEGQDRVLAIEIGRDEPTLRDLRKRPSDTWELLKVSDRQLWARERLRLRVGSKPSEPAPQALLEPVGESGADALRQAALGAFLDYQAAVARWGTLSRTAAAARAYYKSLVEVFLSRARRAYAAGMASGSRPSWLRQTRSRAVTGKGENDWWRD